MTESQDADTPLDSKILHNLLEKYDATSRPANQSKEAAIVSVNFYLRDIFYEKDNVEITGLQLTFREEWNDPRLRFDQAGVSFLTVRDPKKLWVPDIFFSNSKNGHFHELMEPNILMRIYPNGDILYSRRVTINVRCLSDWSFYPFNRVKCPVLAASYGYTTNDMDVIWKTGTPIQVAKSIQSRASPMKLEKYYSDYCTSKTITGEYACIRVDFLFKRNFGPYFLTFYLPSMAAVLLAWLSFWLDRKLSSALPLTLLGISLFVTSTAWLFSVVRSPVNYVTNASNVFTLIGIVFPLYALLHYYVVTAFSCSRKIISRANQNYTDTVNISMKPIMAEEDVEKTNPDEDKKQSTTDKLCDMVSKKSNRPDLIARMLYPSLYTVFNIIYWAVYNEKDNF